MIRFAFIFFALIIGPIGYAEDMDCSGPPLTENRVFQIVLGYKAKHGFPLRNFMNGESWRVVRERCHYKYFETRNQGRDGEFSYFVVSPDGFVVDLRPSGFKTHKCLLGERKEVNYGKKELAKFLAVERSKNTTIPKRPQDFEVTVGDKIGCYFSYTEAARGEGGFYHGYVYEFDYLGNLVRYTNVDVLAKRRKSKQVKDGLKMK